MEKSMTESEGHFNRDLESENTEERATITVPAVESLLDPASGAEVWPEKVLANETFAQQVNERRKLIENMDEVLNHIPMPTTTIEQAITDGQINEHQAEGLYNSLGDLLENDDYKRALLYLPFEFLPQESWRPSNENLQHAIDKFKSIYLATWKDLLTTHDVRASFVDGDVIEVEQRTSDLPRVVKAAHLVPKLAQNGLIAASEVIRLMEKSNDPILQTSIADTIPVLVKLGLVSEEEIKHIQSISDPQITNKLERILSDQTEQIKTPEAPITLSVVHQELAQAHADLDAQDHGDITEKRRQWLQTIKIQEVIDKLASQVSNSIVSNKFSAADGDSFLSAESDSECQEVLIEGIRKAIESQSKSNPKEALALFQSFSETLNTIHAFANPRMELLLTKTLRRLHSLGVVSESVLEQFGVPIQKLDGPISENIQAMGPELQEMGSKIIGITKSSELGSHIYPVALAYGSKIKGYGQPDSDLDKAFFIKPGTSSALESQVHDLLSGKTEFWLQETGNQLTVHDFPAANNPFGESSWTHLLFGGVWVGDKETIKELHNKLLVPYFYGTTDQIHGRNARSAYLEEMEKDALQYRLMHKGYENFAPGSGNIVAGDSDGIDGQSMFWDPGYRRVAIKLYARRVFLPKLLDQNK